MKLVFITLSGWLVSITLIRVDESFVIVVAVLMICL